jgi:hypothetical protein
MTTAMKTAFPVMNSYRLKQMLGWRGHISVEVFSPKVAPDAAAQWRLEERMKLAAASLTRNKRRSTAPKPGLEVHPEHPPALRIVVND